MGTLVEVEKSVPWLFSMQKRHQSPVIVTPSLTLVRGHYCCLEMVAVTKEHMIIVNSVLTQLFGEWQPPFITYQTTGVSGGAGGKQWTSVGAQKFL